MRSVAGWFRGAVAVLAVVVLVLVVAPTLGGLLVLLILKMVGP